MRARRSGPIALIALVLAAMPVVIAADSHSRPDARPDQQIALQARKLIDKAEREGPQRVIVGLNADFVPEGRLQAAAAASQRQEITNSQASLMASLAGLSAVEHHRFRYIPFLALEAGASALKRLASSPTVVSLEEDRPEPPVMFSSNSVIGSPDAWAAGYEGTGWTVAVLDTGVDKTHPFFATRSKVVSEACYSSTVQPHSNSVCPGGLGASTATGSGLNCPLDVEGCAHGTHVAGSVAGDDQSGPNFGVARSSDIIAIQVFSRVDNTQNFRPCANSPCALAYVSDQVAGLERVYELRNEFNIAAVNMSLGGGDYKDPAECDSSQASRKAAIDTLRSVGIATVVASGNSGSKDSVSTPACISSAVSVGATTDGDSVSWFSNVADFLNLLAPGSSITSSVPGGGVSTWDGTSMATPHVAGAWAVLKEKAPAADVATILAALRDTGTPVDDQRSSGTVTDMRRINVDLALNEFGEFLPEFDSTPPAGSPFDFGAVVVGSASDSQVLQVHNLGDAELTLSCSLGGENPAAFVVDTCPDVVASSQSVDIDFNCHPPAVGAHTALLNLDTNDPDEAQVSYELNCGGTAPEFDGTPPPGSDLDFGEVQIGTESDAIIVQVDNLGDAELTIECRVSGDGAAVFEVVQCPVFIAGAASGQIDVVCQPLGLGEYAASLDLMTNDDEGELNYGLLCSGTTDTVFSDGYEGETGL